MASVSVVIVVILLISVIHHSTGAPLAKRTATQTYTYQQFLDLQLGWTLQQVTQYFNNNPGEVQGQFGYGNTNIQIIKYTNLNPIGVILLTFTNNQLTTKAQSGINQNHYPISRTQYDQIILGNTKEEVKTIVGSEGQILGQSINDVVIIGYNGDVNPFAVVQITYLSDKVLSKIEIGL